MHRIAYLGLTLALLLATGCHREATPVAGVSEELARARSGQIHNPRYHLYFDLPAEREASVPATETILVELQEKGTLVLDFRETEAHLKTLSINGDTISVSIENEHIVIPKKYTKSGENSICIDFTAGDQSLNRRDEFLYTLLVPDRARTLFPCFDQPDLKARYTLSLSVPERWTAVSNTSIAEEALEDGGRKIIRFAETEPLSTYLFSFVAGKFERAFSERAGRTISMYYRETDPAKLAQQPAIFSLVFDALDYLETYTGIPYPFAKYDFIVLPDFQYGGMEHTGATLYNDRRIFLGAAPTTDELLGRAQLIAHETAHMWFGDYVTMKWFNDVWTKEVFANWFAAQMVRPAYPEVNHQLGDLKSYYAPAYAEDRTVGSNAIQRPLDNLSNAGLIYCNIIYDKAPVVMDMLARKMGPKAFRRGLQAYLTQYAYGNATWDDLIAILDREADFDVAQWSYQWIKEPDMPCLDAAAYQADSMAYGWYPFDEETAEKAYAQYASLGETARMRSLMNLYENVWRKRIDAARFVTWAAEALYGETNPLIFGSLLDYAGEALRFAGLPLPLLEQTLRVLASDKRRPHELRLQAFRSLYRLAVDPKNCDWLLAVWERQQPPQGLILGESDYTGLAYQLMIRFPGKAPQIRDTQRSRISHPDRLTTFDFVAQAAAPERADRERFFQSLLQVENRRPESRVLSALDLLCHPLRADEAVSYIRPALEILPEIQRTGDIFFPASWCKRILGPQTSVAAKEEVAAFLASHESMHPLLKTKILQAAGYLLQ
ncbi:MAG: aminopeptidase [Bacteroidales bacterium]|nr:aminopeptidase [Bacteroidales bacterium]